MFSRNSFHLLLSSIIGLGVAIPQAQAAEKAHPFESEIKAFEASDRTNPPPAGAILFVGSSSIRIWKNLAEDFPGKPVVNRGFGGSQMADLAYYANRIVVPYRPKAIYVYEGDNDLPAKKSPAQILSAAQEFVRQVETALPGTSITFISVKPSPSRWHLADEVRETNRLLQDWIRSNPHLHYVDVFTPMLDQSGRPRPELFLADQLHMNRKGYEIWTSILRPTLP